MIVSPSLKMIFVHIPKNAGTTVETIFDPWLDANRDLHISKASTLPKNFASAGVNPHKALEKHSSADQIRAAMDREVFRKSFSFALTRNPFARCYSAYRFLRARTARDAASGAESDALRQQFLTLSFEDVCRDLFNISFLHQLFMPQLSWLPSKGSLNYLGRVENMAEDMGFIFDLLRLPAVGVAAIPVRNSKAEPEEWRAMSGPCVDAIRRFYAADFERFGYSTDPMGNDSAPSRMPVRGRGSRPEGGQNTNGNLPNDTSVPL